MSNYSPVAAHVIGRDPTLWYATVEVDKGSADGVHKEDPVIGDGALVGKVSTVAPNVSFVTLITDHSFAVSAEVQNNTGDTGVLVPAVGNPNQLLLQYLPPGRAHQAGRAGRDRGLQVLGARVAVTRPASRSGPCPTPTRTT